MLSTLLKRDGFRHLKNLFTVLGEVIDKNTEEEKNISIPKDLKYRKRG